MIRQSTTNTRDGTPEVDGPANVKPVDDNAQTGEVVLPKKEEYYAPIHSRESSAAKAGCVNQELADARRKAAEIVAQAQSSAHAVFRSLQGRSP